MPSHRRILTTAVAMLLAVPGVMTSVQTGEGGPQMRRSAVEQAPEALIASWTMNPTKSKYQGAAPRSLVRSFDYTRDGAILVSYVSVAQNGLKTIGHWAVTLDGQWAPEFTRDWGATPFMMISLKKIDDRSLDWAYGRWGQVLGKGGWLLSADGRTLTQTVTMTNAQGQKITNVVVYDKQE